MEKVEEVKVEQVQGAASDSATSSTSSTSPSAHRVIFVDLARALAVTFMLYGHTASALLAPQYQTGRWFDIWLFQRGLTSSLFLLLGGFAFSVATTRRWSSHLTLSSAVVRRVRRFGLFVLLGYALHLPGSNLAVIAAAEPARWRAFLAVDVLQLIGATLIGLQLLVLMVRSRRAFMAAALAMAAATVLATPAVWRIDWAQLVPPAVAAYVSQATGSQFPLFPWMAFILMGAGLGQMYARWGAADLLAFARRALIAPAIVLVIAALVVRPREWTLFGPGPGAFVPAEIMMRTGACLLILAAFAYLSARITRLPHLFAAVAQESLLIYFVHLCIVYGSAWNAGLVRIYGASRTPAQTLFFVVLVVSSMAALAWHWNRFKHVRPHAARWTSYAVGAALLVWLL